MIDLRVDSMLFSVNRGILTKNEDDTRDASGKFIAENFYTQDAQFDAPSVA